LVFSIPTIAFWVFVCFNLLWREVKRTQIKLRIASKKKPSQAIAVESDSEESAQENDPKDRTGINEKKTLDSFLKKID